MKYKTPVFLFLAALIMSLAGCDITGDIFRAGVGVGIFLVVVMLVMILYILVSIWRKS